ncbi:MAG TPA: hypothetical protein VIK78_02885 [Ruminiclostridium sp.]
MRNVLEIFMVGAKSVLCIEDGARIHTKENEELPLIYWTKQVVK